MTIVYRGGPYAGQDDYLTPPPHRLRVCAACYYQRTSSVDDVGRVVFEWIAADAADAELAAS